MYGRTDWSIFEVIRIILNKATAFYVNSSNARKMDWLRKQGMHIGESCRLNCNVKAFSTEPYLITLGAQVLVADGVHFITHDGGINVLRNLKMVSGETDKMAPIQVGNNVYIGTGAYIMPGVKIGNDCIIGAGAIVTKDIPDRSVAVGIPARVIETVEEYHRHAVKKQCLYETKKMTSQEKREFYEECNLRNTWFCEETP